VEYQFPKTGKKATFLQSGVWHKDKILTAGSNIDTSQFVAGTRYERTKMMFWSDSVHADGKSYRHHLHTKTLFFLKVVYSMPATREDDFVVHLSTTQFFRELTAVRSGPTSLYLRQTPHVMLSRLRTQSSICRGKRISTCADIPPISLVNAGWPNSIEVIKKMKRKRNRRHTMK